MNSITFSIPVIVTLSLLLLSACTVRPSADTAPLSDTDSGVATPIATGSMQLSRHRERRNEHMRDTELGNTGSTHPTPSRSASGVSPEKTVENTTSVSPMTTTPIANPTTTVSTVKATATISPSTTSTAVRTVSKSISYTTPSSRHGGGSISTTFNISLDATDTITAVSASTTSSDHEDAQYHRRFNSAATSKIVGKKVSALALSAVGGASLTTDAFMQAIASL